MADASPVTATDRLGLTLFLAVTAHALVVLGITFNVETPERTPPPDRTLEIMVVQNPQQSEKPEKPDFLAQTSQQGGGNLEKPERPKTTITPPAPQQQVAPKPALDPATPPVTPAVKPPPRRVITTPTPARKQVRVQPKKPPKPVNKRPVTAAQLLASTNREISRLTAELDKKSKAYAKRPRRKFVTASTQEYKYANYLEAWRKKVERIGNLNYPDEARRRKLYGNLVLHVAVRVDGTVKEITVKKSSGHRLLDDAAIRIVRLASPFAPFPKEIRQEADIIDIIRTWQFRNNNQLFSK